MITDSLMIHSILECQILVQKRYRVDVADQRIVSQKPPEDKELLAHIKNCNTGHEVWIVRGS